MKRITAAEQKRLLTIQYSGSWPKGFLPNYSPYSGFVRGAGASSETPQEKQSNGGVRGGQERQVAPGIAAMSATLVQPKLPRVEFYPDKPGEPYRPCNGTEGEFFHAMWCEECERDKVGEDAQHG